MRHKPDSKKSGSDRERPGITNSLKNNITLTHLKANLSQSKNKKIQISDSLKFHAWRVLKMKFVSNS